MKRLPEPAGGVARDRYGRPLIHVPGQPKPQPYTRCTTFVDAIEDKTALIAWHKRMVLLGAARAPRLTQRAASLDPADRVAKRELDKLAEQAGEAAGASDKRNRGTHLHQLSERVDRCEPLPLLSLADVADLAAYLAATVHLRMQHIEQLVVVDELAVAGTPDRICRYAGPGPDGTYVSGTFIADLKTGSLDFGAVKIAAQLAVYSRGEFYDHHTGARTPLPGVDQTWGLVVHLPAGTAQCTVHWIDLRIGWQAVLAAQQVRDIRKQRRVLKPFLPGGGSPSNGVAPTRVKV